MQKQIEQQLQDNIKDVQKLEVVIEGSTCGGAGIDLLIVSDEFKGMMLLKRHQKIHSVLDQIKDLSYHKITIKAYTVDEYQKKLSEGK